MTKEELKKRTKQFALEIIKLVEELPNTRAGYTIGNQLIRSGTSVAANYRSACRAGSNAIFTASGKTARLSNPKSTIRNPK